MSNIEQPIPRRVYTGTEGQTDRPACGPLLSDCRQHHVATTGAPHGWNVYRCDRCGDEEWL